MMMLQGKAHTTVHHRSNQPPGVQRRARAAGATAAAPGNDAPSVVAIAGAGIAGLATAVGLHKLGVRVAVLERAPALRQEGSALALWSNAWRALDALGVGQLLRDDYLMLDRIELVSSGGRLLRRFAFDECGVAAPSRGGLNEMRGVSRPRLLQALADQLPPGAVRFGCGVQALGEDAQGRPLLQLSNGEQLSCRVCVGADGANSAVAKYLGLPPAAYSGYVAYRGLATYPPGQLPLPDTTIRQVFGRGVRAGMYPLTQQDVYWYICFNADESAGRPGALAADGVSEALAAVEGFAWGIDQAVRNTDPGCISRSSIRDRWTRGPFGRGAVTLAGDAAHPMTPNLGQGGCTAIEDAVVLARSLAPLLAASAGGGGGGGEVEACLRSYEAQRAARCLALTVRSNLFGAALQLPYAPVCAVRDLFVERLFSPAHFLDHTAYDCGTLQSEAA